MMLFLHWQVFVMYVLKLRTSAIELDLTFEYIQFALNTRHYN